MKVLKFSSIAFCLALALLAASPSYAQSYPQIVMVGSSGAFNSVAIAAVSSDPITSAAAPCNPGKNAAFFWSSKASDTTRAFHATAIDPRPGVNAETGNLWVTWSDEPLLTTSTICAYFSVDSVVGQRLLFGTNGTAHGHLSLDARIPVNSTTCSLGTGEVGDGAVPYIADSTNTLPCDVFTALNGAQFNAAATDIRPEDALYANVRAMTPCAGNNCATDTNKTGEGYGPWPTGQAVQSAYSATNAQVIGYHLGGNDPISGDAVTPGVSMPIGAYPVIVFANIKAATTNAGDFGNAANTPNNILSHDIAAIWSGLLTRTTDVTGNLSVTGTPLSVVQREAVSGTFNTFEWQSVRDKGIGLSQEIGVNPASNGCFTGGGTQVECGNPFYHVAADGATRSRAIGTGELVNAVGGNLTSTCGTGLPNGLGYGFWTFATFSNSCVRGNTKYLTVDGVDPILPAYAGGVWPTCSGTVASGITCTGGVTLQNVDNGSYRIWNIIRVVMLQTYTAPANGPSVPALILAAQDQAHSTLFDFVPFVYCGTGTCTPATVSAPGSGHPLGITGPTGVVTGLHAFRSHYSLPTPIALNGDSIVTFPMNPGFPGSVLDGTNQALIAGFPPYSENGGDMGGAAFSVQSDVDYLSDTGHELINNIQ